MNDVHQDDSIKLEQVNLYKNIFKININNKQLF